MPVWIILIICGYLLGAVPAAYLVARSQGIDPRKTGTGQVGSGNVWRMTSRKFGLLVGFWDFIKGMVMAPVVTVFAIEDPEIEPMAQEATTAALAGPPRKRPMSAKERLIR